VLQEAMKRIFKQNCIATKSITKGIKSYFVYFQPNSIYKPLQKSQNIRWNYYIARSKLHPTNWTNLDTLQMLAKT